MPSLNVIAETVSEILLLKYELKDLSTLRRSKKKRPWLKVKVIGLRKDNIVSIDFSRTILTANVMGIAWKRFEIFEHVV